MGDGLTGTITQQQKVTLTATTLTAGTFVVASQTTAGAAVLTTAGTTISTGVVAGSAALSSVAATVAGVLASIPVAGWIALAVIAVVVLVAIFWDDICDFFSGLWSWMVQKATIVYDWVANTALPWVVDTADQVWQTVTATAGRIGKRAERQAKALAAAMAAAIAAGTAPLKTDAVYLILMQKSGLYEKRKWGVIPGVHNFPNDRNGDPKYKYGTTKNGVSGRYVAGSYIGIQISLGNMSSIMIREYMTFGEARILEKQSIFFYYQEHGAFPPGNSKLG